MPAYLIVNTTKLSDRNYTTSWDVAELCDNRITTLQPVG